PDHLAELGQLRRSEDDQREHHDEEHFLEADVEHVEPHPIAGLRRFPAKRGRSWVSGRTAPDPSGAATARAGPCPSRRAKSVRNICRVCYLRPGRPRRPDTVATEETGRTPPIV